LRRLIHLSGAGGVSQARTFEWCSDGRGSREAFDGNSDGAGQGGVMTCGWRRNTRGLITTTLLVTLFAAVAPGPGRAAEPPGEALFEKNDCKTCHAVDHKLVGPSYDDVAKKYAGQPNAEQTLIAAIKNGHVGTWGQVPMPPHPSMPDSEIKTIVDWILTLK
jgi:cytochrome c